MIWVQWLARGVLCGVVLLGALPRASTAQQVASSSRSTDVADTSALARPVTVSVRDVSLRSAIDLVARVARIDVQYRQEQLDAVTKPVTLSVTNWPLGKAFDALLAGTSLKAVMIRRDLIGISRVAATAATTGVVTGRVVDGGTKQPLSRATVTVRGTKMTTLTDAHGVYTLAEVPAGTYTLAARLLGYGAATHHVTVAAGDTAVVSFALSPIAARLDEIVTTVTGDRKKLEMGNSIATINADSIVPTTPIRNLSDLLNGRAPGVDVLSTSGAVGSGSQIRIRGVSSLIGSSDPIVIVDGIRVDASFSQPIPGTPQPAQFGYAAATNQSSQGAPATSRLNDIDPETIEKVEILKGPSASTLYGSDAANGVIVITTKKGRPGPTRWTFFGQQGISHMEATFPDAWHGWGTWLSNPGNTSCNVSQAGAGLCTQDSVTHYNPMNARETSPLGTGTATKVGAQVSGGSQTLQYFLGSDYDTEVGLFELPAFDNALYVGLRNGQPLPSWVHRPNTLDALHLTSSLTSQLASTADVSLTSDFLHQYHRDDGTNAYVLKSILSAGYRDSATAGWGPFGSAAQAFTQLTSDVINRGHGGVNANWRPTPHWSARGTAGVDYTDRTDDAFQPTDILPNAYSSKITNAITTTVRTGDVSTTLDVPLTPSMSSRATVGGQYTRQDVTGQTLNGSGLPAGGTTVNGASTLTASQYNSASATAGWYIEESIALNQRAFLTAAVRGDASSSFGSQAKAVYYPKWSASWLISEEPFFPRIPGLNDLRVRAAFGHAGIQPSFDARFRSYRDSAQFINNGTTSGLLISTIGNPDLRPERSTELEGGFDLGLWSERLTMEVTAYHKLTRDALVSRTLPPSLGISSRQENLGKVSNSGLEIQATVRPIVSPFLEWTASISLSQNKNKLLTLGPTSIAGISDVAGTAESRYVPGYPLNGFWERPILGYSDTNGDGVIELGEIRMADSAVYRGQPFPKAQVGWHNDLAFMSGRVNLGVALNYTGGLTQLNAALWTQANNQVDQAHQDVNASQLSQAYAVAGYGTNGIGSTWGYLEQISYMRLSELSLTFNAPASFARRLRASSANISIMGRNLALWSSYHGADPEVNSNILANQIIDDGGVPQPRDWTLRINLGF